MNMDNEEISIIMLVSVQNSKKTKKTSTKKDLILYISELLKRYNYHCHHAVVSVA